ncbi:MAG: hypothetical protein AAF962_26815 [Actinomycetota bacterium]
MTAAESVSATNPPAPVVEAQGVTVTQELGLVPAFTLAENIALILDGSSHVDRAGRAAVAEAASAYSLAVDPAVPESATEERP